MKKIVTLASLLFPVAVQAADIPYEVGEVGTSGMQYAYSASCAPTAPEVAYLLHGKGGSALTWFSENHPENSATTQLLIDNDVCVIAPHSTTSIWEGENEIYEVTQIHAQNLGVLFQENPDDNAYMIGFSKGCSVISKVNYFYPASILASDLRSFMANHCHPNIVGSIYSKGVWIRGMGDPKVEPQTVAEAFEESDVPQRQLKDRNNGEVGYEHEFNHDAGALQWMAE